MSTKINVNLDLSFEEVCETIVSLPYRSKLKTTLEETLKGMGISKEYHSYKIGRERKGRGCYIFHKGDWYSKDKEILYIKKLIQDTHEVEIPFM